MQCCHAGGDDLRSNRLDHEIGEQGDGCGPRVIALVSAGDLARAINDDKSGLLVDGLHAEGF